MSRYPHDHVWQFWKAEHDVEYRNSEGISDEGEHLEGYTRKTIPYLRFVCECGTHKRVLMHD